jgi:hypothetical protein
VAPCCCLHGSWRAFQTQRLRGLCCEHSPLTTPHSLSSSPTHRPPPHHQPCLQSTGLSLGVPRIRVSAVGWLVAYGLAHWRPLIESCWTVMKMSQPRLTSGMFPKWVNLSVLCKIEQKASESPGTQTDAVGSDAWQLLRTTRADCPAPLNKWRGLRPPSHITNLSRLG